MAFPFPTHFTALLNPALKASIDALIPTEASHGAAVDACVELATLCDHAVARDYFHPGIEKFLQMTKAQPPLPHAEGYGAAMVKLHNLSLRNDQTVQEWKEWKEEVDPIIVKMKVCVEKLREIFDDRDVKDFLAIERGVRDREMASGVEDEKRDIQDARVDHEVSG
ncbi:MAG: hypothetical protein ASARMPRED_006764 [Alectoria sarmentosa]|nr:MAG: hypothetical protein ASARMPRED_006764 [Alectoria sarmentosa]